MAEPTVPDELFNADFVASDEHDLADRRDWSIVDGQLVHAPAVGRSTARPAGQP
ncbi:hypothetical protein ACIQVR_27340 [Streptomyces xanthochromogenes]|uniref:hypothetical protein n=1 Tax=Streptomyces xanthochromogenes TaxID=67384 RepID=UPI00381F7043